MKSASVARTAREVSGSHPVFSTVFFLTNRGLLVLKLLAMKTFIDWIMYNV